MAGRKRSCFSESRHAIPTLLHRFVCLRKKGVLWRASSPPTAPGMDVWSARPNDGIPSKRFPTATPVALHGLRQDTAAHTGESSPALGAGSTRGARLTAWTRAVDDVFAAWM